MSTGDRRPDIEVLHLLDRLEAIVTSGTRLPLTSRSLVDEQEFVDILDQIRAAVPEEVRQAKRVSQDREKMLLQAQSEAETLLANAREQAQQMLDQDELVRSAREQAEAYVQEALDRAEEVRNGADEYAFAVLDRLEEEVMRVVATIRRGKATLQRTSQAAAEDAGAVHGADTSRLR